MTQSKVPSGSGLGGSSALSVAVAARGGAPPSAGSLDSDTLWPVVRDAEAQAIGVPTGVQDYLAAIHGGVLGIHLEPGALRVEKLATDPAQGGGEPACSWTPRSATSPGSTTGRSSRGRSSGNENVTHEPRPRSRPPPATCATRWSSSRYEDVPAIMTREMAGAEAPRPRRQHRPRSRRSPRRRPPRAARPRSAARAGGGMVSVWAVPGKQGEGRGGHPRRRVQDRRLPARPARPGGRLTVLAWPTAAQAFV